MPPKMMVAKTVLLAKNDQPQSIADGRPITILATLTRLASKILADQLLRQLADRLPWQISGGLPQRGTKDLMMQQQYMIEQAVTQKSELCGYTLDLSKAFNKIPRYPLKAIFRRFRVPQVVIHYWFESLKHLVRYPHVKGTLGACVAASSGVPEGDSCSVLAMILMSSTYYFIFTKLVGVWMMMGCCVDLKVFCVTCSTCRRRSCVISSRIVGHIFVMIC